MLSQCTPSPTTYVSTPYPVSTVPEPDTEVYCGKYRFSMSSNRGNIEITVNGVVFKATVNQQYGWSSIVFDDNNVPINALGILTWCQYDQNIDLFCFESDSDMYSNRSSQWLASMCLNNLVGI